MKWMVMALAVLLVPVSAQAVEHWKAEEMKGAWVVVIGEKFGKAKDPRAIQFFLEPHEDADHLRAKVRLFIPKHNSPDAITQGRCELWVNSQLVEGLGDHWLMGDHGRELWSPQLREKDRVVLGISWKQNPVMEYATIETENSYGSYTRSWETARVEHYFKTEPEAEHAQHVRGFSLDEVC